jgi:hypothetical protein
MYISKILCDVYLFSELFAVVNAVLSNASYTLAIAGITKRTCIMDVVNV